MNENELQHHGILGQKWGVRRFQNKDGTLTTAGKKRYFVDPRETSPKIPKGAVVNMRSDKKKASEKKASEMSDDELRKRLNRLQMEKQYSQLSNETTKKGRGYLDKLIKAGTTVATVTTTAVTIYKNFDKIGEIIDKVAGKMAEADKSKWVL